MSIPLPPSSPPVTPRRPIQMTCTPLKPSRPPTRPPHLPPIDERMSLSKARLDAATVQSIRSQYRLTPPVPISEAGYSPPQGSILSSRSGPPTPPLSSASVSSAESTAGDPNDPVFMPSSRTAKEKEMDQKRTVSFYALLAHRPSCTSLVGNEAEEDNVFYAAFPLPPGSRTLANGEACLPYSGLANGKPAGTKAAAVAPAPAPIFQRARSDTVSTTSSDTHSPIKDTQSSAAPPNPPTLATAKKRPSMPSPPTRFAYARRTSFPESCYSTSTLSSPRTPHDMNAVANADDLDDEVRDSIMSLPFIWPEGFVPGERRGSADSQMSSRSAGVGRSKSMRAAKSMHDLKRGLPNGPSHSPSASETSIVRPDSTSAHSRSTHSSTSPSRFPRRPSVRSVFPVSYQAFSIEPTIPEYPNCPPSPVPSSVCIPLSQFPSRRGSAESMAAYVGGDMVQGFGLGLGRLREEGEEEIPTVEGLLRQLSNDSLLMCYTSEREEPAPAPVAPAPMAMPAPAPPPLTISIPSPRPAVEKALPPLPPAQAEPNTPMTPTREDVARYWQKRMERRRAGAFTREALPPLPISPPATATSSVQEDVFRGPPARPGRSFEIRDAGRASPFRMQDAVRAGSPYEQGVRAGSPYGQSVREVPVLPMPRACTSPEPLSEKVKNALKRRDLQRSPCSDRGPIRPPRPMRSPSPLFEDAGSVYSMPSRPSLEKASTYPILTQDRATPSPPGTRGRSGSLSSLDFADRLDEMDDTRGPPAPSPEPAIPQMIPSKAARKLGVSEDTVMVVNRPGPSPSKPSKAKKSTPFALLSMRHGRKRLEISPPLDTLPEHVDVDPVVLYTPSNKSPASARCFDVPRSSSPLPAHMNRSSPDLVLHHQPQFSLKEARSMAYLNGKHRPAGDIPIPSSNWI